jgi:anthranilate synthase component 1
VAGLRLDHLPDLPGLARALPDQFPYLLESTARGSLGSFSILLYASDECLVLHPDGTVRGPGAGTRFFERLDDWYRSEQQATDAGDSHPLPFNGGWFLFLGYEAVSEIEGQLRLPANETGLPDAIAHRCPGAVIVGHSDDGEGAAWLVGETPAVLEELRDSMMRGERSPARFLPSGEPELQAVQAEDPSRFRRSVRRIHEYLRAGDVFQVNLSRAWTGCFREPPDPFALYESLRHANPAPFAGLMRWEEHVLLSSSPERLVETRGRLAQTRPIAGTRPRGLTDAEDRALSEELVENLKERAEHIMLIDLERNDLGRVCEPGSIEVNELMVVESYAHVHHIVSNVRGVLRPGASPVDAVRAVFPGGTITGCPKVRCMEIIAELEQAGRGFYTGSMGYLDRHGNMDLNILIRSLLLGGRHFTFRTGAGIVADSDAQAEVYETDDKARGMLVAVESHGKELKHA